MGGSELLEFTARSLDGQRQLATALKRRVGASGCATAARLDYADDAPFLEPSLFSYFASARPKETLDQLLLGSVEPAHRPPAIEAYADRRGLINIPRIGHLRTSMRERRVTFERDGYQGCAVRAGATLIPHTVEPVRSVRGSDIEICPLADPFLDARLEEVGEVAVVRESIQALELAFDILGRVAPDWLERLGGVLRRVVLFRGPETNSFAAPAAHGSVFLQTNDDSNEVSFIEDLVHQGGHVLFTAATLDRESFFAVDADTPLSAITGKAHERRTAYVVLHGVFTECIMCICLHRCLEVGVSSGRMRHELRGRLSFALKRLSLDLTTLEHEGLLSPRGTLLRKMFGRVFDEIYGLAKEAVVTLDLRNQPYTFSYRRFAQLNPMARTAAGSR